MNVLSLGPIDYVFTGVASQPITLAFLYKHKLDPTRLRESLYQTLDAFPLLQSRLVKSTATDYKYRFSKEGLIFDVFESTASIKESKKIEQYITPVCSVESNPLTKIALTQASDGSVLAVSISHALVDGYSYFHFLSSWARINRGDRIMNPSFQREGLYPTSETGKTPVTPSRMYTDCGLFWGGKRNKPQNDSVYEERISVSKETIGSWLEDAKKEQPHVLLSENDVITASLWKKYIPLWERGDHNPETYITCPVDFRRVLKSVPKNYFGCAVCFTSTSLDLDTLEKATIGELAFLVNRSTRKVNHDYVINSLQTLERLRKEKGLAAFEEVHVRHPKHGLIVTNLTRMPMRDIDFGSSTPYDFLIYSEVLGSAAILPAENGVEIVVMHPSQ